MSRVRIVVGVLVSAGVAGRPADDGGGNREATLAALPRIVAGIRARGLSLVPLGRVG